MSFPSGKFPFLNRRLKETYRLEPDHSIPGNLSEGNSKRDSGTITEVPSKSRKRWMKLTVQQQKNG